MLAKFRPFAELDVPDKRRRNLPHWETAGATYFITFRLADAIPAGIAREIQVRVEAWLRVYGLTDRCDVWRLPSADRADFRKTISVEEERWLDSGHGCCVFQEENCRAVMVEALHHFDGGRYTLDGFVIMPNHVHVLILPHEGWPLGKIIASWKQFSARRINALTRRRGDLWQHDSYDHIVRAWDKLEECRRYIAANPAKARLRAGRYHLGSGSGILQ